MAPRAEGSQLKRTRGSPSADAELESFKKPRRSERISHKHGDAPEGQKTPVSHKQHLPSPVTHSTTDDSLQSYKEGTVTPPEGRPSQVVHRSPEETLSLAQNSLAQQGFSSPLNDTQALPSQLVDPQAALSDEVEDEVKEGVWGYIFPLDTRYGGRCIVLRKRGSCPLPKGSEDEQKDKDKPCDKAKKGLPSGGYLIGRHPECDIVVDDPIVSNRHCLIFAEHKGNDTVVVLEDLSSNGTFVNEAIVGRNQRRELQEQDEIAVKDRARFIFRYPKSRSTSKFAQQYTLLGKLGKGHFAEVFACVEKSSGQRYAVKVFSKTPGVDERSSKSEGLQLEIAVLMGVSHPNVLCLKDTFNEPKAVYLVLELAPEGELFNFIVEKQKLGESESRKLFSQLFHGVKYLHDRGIVHRDIKPENILLMDRELHVKLADFGLAKIIGEESFTTTLCGTPSYVAPEILADNRHRRYTKAVDVWSLGVVLYICLCGFPPFSDELTSDSFPYNLSQQIRTGRFNYPSPYWDSVGDPALHLIDNMLIVDPEKRYTVDQCLNHPWMTQSGPSVHDSTDGLVGGLAGLEVNRRGMVRERTLLSSINTVQVTKVPANGRHKNQETVKVFKKNVTDKTAGAGPSNGGPSREARPSENRDPGVFMEAGGKGDEALFAHDPTSNYPSADIGEEKAKTKTAQGKGKDKAR
ncbi:CAMK protein kinase [Gaeumannomyces tritici R3-111a-1]|uniref:CAMK protein kinase n=1 Tax=Gaeumannomyces tritici (strain R3-111a-1) TaxID=644352 RepID=J3NJZ7_GAET3|nr:CAMK protein kinase [Gaeumannomyces tritici R3-111a-1]EJT81601.1 CAMK protein kinase [Gaeumannomyces tritici R3-111a-1]